MPDHSDCFECCGEGTIERRCGSCYGNSRFFRPAYCPSCTRSIDAFGNTCSLCGGEYCHPIYVPCGACQGVGHWLIPCTECHGTGVNLSEDCHNWISYDVPGYWVPQLRNVCAYAITGGGDDCDCMICRNRRRRLAGEEESDEDEETHGDEDMNDDDSDSGSDSSHRPPPGDIDWEQTMRHLVGYGCETCRLNRNGPRLDDYDGQLQSVAPTMPHSFRYNTTTPDEPLVLVPSLWAELHAADTVANAEGNVGLFDFFDGIRWGYSGVLRDSVPNGMEYLLHYLPPESSPQEFQSSRSRWADLLRPHTG